MTDGYTVGMALVYEVLTAERVVHSLDRENMKDIAPASVLYLPGLAAPIHDDLAEKSGRSVTVGPVCAAELPLFFGEKIWKVA